MYDVTVTVKLPDGEEVRAFSRVDIDSFPDKEEAMDEIGSLMMREVYEAILEKKSRVSVLHLP